jgi:hypothetical protein
MHWTLTTDGLSDHVESRHYEDAQSAVDAYQTRISQLEGDGFQPEGDEAVVYGRRWSRTTLRMRKRRCHAISSRRIDLWIVPIGSRSDGDLQRAAAFQPKMGAREGADDGLDGVSRHVPRGGDARLERE